VSTSITLRELLVEKGLRLELKENWLHLELTEYYFEAESEAHSWNRAPLGPMAIDLFNVKTFAIFFFVVPSFS
jgi:hypothetical protein